MAIKRSVDAARNMMQRSKDTHVDPMPLSLSAETEKKEPAKKARVGRRRRTIQHTNGFTVYLEDKHLDFFNNLGGFDKQDIARTAVDEFLKKHGDPETGYLDHEGMRLISDYVKRTTES